MKPYRLMLRVHQSLYQRSRGRIGHRLLGVPTLLLTTTGRRTRRSRTSALIYARAGDDVLVVASNGGSDSAPGWLHNLTADPSVTVRIGRRDFAATAHAVPPGDDRYPALLAHCDAVNRGRYSRYQRLTTRPIPVVVLTPAGGRRTG